MQACHYLMSCPYSFLHSRSLLSPACPLWENMKGCIFISNILAAASPLHRTGYL